MRSVILHFSLFQKGISCVLDKGPAFFVETYLPQGLLRRDALNVQVKLQPRPTDSGVVSGQTNLGDAS